MKISGNKHTILIELTEEEYGEHIKIEAFGEMLVDGFWIYDSYKIKLISPREKDLTKEEKEKILKYVIEHNSDNFKIVL